MSTPSRILLIEDDEALRQSLARLLVRSGYQVTEAAHGHAALQCMRQEPAQVVISDMLMPYMDGVETILALRRNWPGVKIMAVSGGGMNSAETYITIARAVGAHKVMAKPLIPSKFLEAIGELLGVAKVGT